MKKEIKPLSVLWGIILVSCVLIFKDYLFGDSYLVFNDVASDTRQQYLMQYSSIIRHLQAGNFSLWDATNGFGASFFALNPFNLFLMAIYLFGFLFGASHIAGFLVYLLILQILLAGTVCYAYLGEFSLSRTARTIAAFMYAFCGYLLVWGQHYQFGCYVIFLPFLLFLAERAIRRQRLSLSLSLGVFATVISSVYMSYMTLLTLGVYLILRLAFHTDFVLRKKIRLFFLCCGSILLGLGLSMIIFLPNVAYMSQVSSRLSSDSSIFVRFFGNIKPYPVSYYLTLFYRFFSSNLEGLNDGQYTGYLNYFEAPVVFVGILFVLLLIQYIFTIHRQTCARRVKILQGVCIALCAFVLLLQAGSLLFNGFVIAFSRHTFVLMPFFALAAAFALDRIYRDNLFSIPGAVISLALLIAVYYLAGKGTAPHAAGLPYRVLILLGLSMLVLLFILSRKSLPHPAVQKRLIAGCLLLLTAVNAVNEGIGCYANRDTLKKSDTTYQNTLYSEEVTRGLDTLRTEDTAYYRVEKDYEGASCCMDSMAQYFRSISAYNSTQNKYVQEFTDTLWPGLVRLVNSQYSYRQTQFDRDMCALLGVKYILSYNPDLEGQGYTLYKKSGNLNIYRNEQVSSIGKFYTRSIADNDLPDDLSGLDTALLLSDTVILNDPSASEKGAQPNARTPDAHTNKANTDAAEPTEAAVKGQSLTATYPLQDIPCSISDFSYQDEDTLTIDLSGYDLSDYKRLYATFTITPDAGSGGVIYTRAQENAMVRYDMAPAGQTTQIRLPLPVGCQAIEIGDSALGKLNGSIADFRLHGSLSPLRTDDAASTVDIRSTGNDSIIDGTVTADESGILFLSIPFENGWKAYIDGEKAVIRRADYGFMGLSLPTGTHQISLVYTAPGLIAGCWITVIFALLFLIILIRRKCKKSQLPNGS